MSADSCKSATECARLLEFKDFLAATAAASEGAATAGGNELARNCVTRSSNETYRINSEERQAEVISAIWKQLISKDCPRDFQLKLLHTASEQLAQEFRNAKECEINVDDNAALEPQYDLLKLQKFVANHLLKLLLKLNDNAAADQLQHYAEQPLCQPPALDCKCISSSLLHTVACVKNKPRKMEDRHVCLERYGEMYRLPAGHTDCRFFGVFDGHSGALSACYATSQLPQLLAQQLQNAVQFPNPDFYRNAFELAFLQADERFAHKRITSGTTAVCALLYSTHLYIAWVGDSKALLVGKRTQLQLVKPHKPESPDERRRIEAAGGTVIQALGQWRVNGILNVARSIGDYCVEAVIAEPDFVDVELSEAHDFLVLGTDGLWDHVPEALIIDTVYACLAEPTTKLDDIPKLLVDAAKEHDSQDNITVVIVLLKARELIVRD